MQDKDYAKYDRDKLHHWISFRRLQRGWARILSPEGLVEDVRLGDIDAAIEGNADYHRVFHSHSEWIEFLCALLLDEAVHELSCSDKVN